MLQRDGDADGGFRRLPIGFPGAAGYRPRYRQLRRRV